MPITMQDRLDMAAVEIRKMRVAGEVNLNQLSGIETMLVQFIDEHTDDVRAYAWASQSIDLIAEARQDAMEKKASAKH